MSKNDSFKVLMNFKFWFVDTLILTAMYILAYILRIGVGQFVLNVPEYRELFLVTILSHTLIVYCFDCYKDFYSRGYLKEFVAVFKHILFTFMIMMAYLFASKSGEHISRLMLSIFVCMSFAVLYAVHIIIKLIRKSYIKSGNSINVILVTVPSMLNKFEESSDQFHDYNIIGIADFSDELEIGSEIGGLKVVSNSKTTSEFIKTNWIDEVFIFMPRDSKVNMEFLNACCDMGVTVNRKLPIIEEVEFPRHSVRRIGKMMFITSEIVNPDAVQMGIKRFMDIVISIIGLIFTGLFTLIFAPIIYIQSPGPIFFSQVRVGRNGKKFKMYKFRSMYPDAEKRKAELMKDNKMDGLMFKVDNDPRITPIGRFLRKSSIDEFPQFLNVLLGQMSVVGTRPPTVDEYEKYEYHHKARLAMKPGITGMWQASGRSDITDFEKVVEMDREYIENWTIGLDIKIMFKTVAAVLSAKGSE